MAILVRTINTFYSIVSIKFIAFLSVAEQHRLTVNAASGFHFLFCVSDDICKTIRAPPSYRSYHINHDGQYCYYGSYCSIVGIPFVWDIPTTMINIAREILDTKTIFTALHWQKFLTSYVMFNKLFHFTLLLLLLNNVTLQNTHTWFSVLAKCKWTLE